jgi:hypothetical protein
MACFLPISFIKIGLSYLRDRDMYLTKRKRTTEQGESKEKKVRMGREIGGWYIP